MLSFSHSRSYEVVKTALEQRMEVLGNTDELGCQLAAKRA
jgi:hypothetical protein